MASFSKVILMCNLTREPELRQTPAGKSVMQLGVAVNRKYKDLEGNEREEVTFIDVDVFGRTAEVINQYCQKGSPLLIEGRLKLDSWENNDGEKRSKLKVILENFQFVGSRLQEGSQTPVSNSNQGYTQRAHTPEPERHIQHPGSDFVGDNTEPF